MTNHLLHTYQSLPVSFSHGKGAWVWDKAGKQYLDALGGIAVCGLGHAHPKVTQVIQEQAAKILHTSNIYTIDHQLELADKLTKLSGMDAIYCGNSGAEANEAAFKLARLYGHQRAIEHPQIVVMERAFHGRTLACLSASGSRKVQAGFEPLVQGFVRCAYNDLEALAAILQHNHEVVAVMLEPIQGEGGLIVPDEDYLPDVYELCQQHECLILLDEVQTGVGRTGKFYAYQHYDFLPDIVTSAKAIGNGIPIGVCLTHGHATTLFHPGNHGSTFGGNPFATKVAHTVISIIDAEGLAEQAACRGHQLMTGLKHALSSYHQVKDIRGKGLMLGIELDQPCRELLSIGLEHGLLFSITAERVIRLLPPYIISEEEVDQIIERISTCIAQFYRDKD